MREASAQFSKEEIRNKLVAAQNGTQYKRLKELLWAQQRHLLTVKASDVTLQNCITGAAVDTIRNCWKFGHGDPNAELATWITILATVNLTKERLDNSGFVLKEKGKQVCYSRVAAWYIGDSDGDARISHYITATFSIIGAMQLCRLHLDLTLKLCPESLLICGHFKMFKVLKNRHAVKDGSKSPCKKMPMRAPAAGACRKNRQTIDSQSQIAKWGLKLETRHRVINMIFCNKTLRRHLRTHEYSTLWSSLRLTEAH